MNANLRWYSNSNKLKIINLSSKKDTYFSEMKRTSKEFPLSRMIYIKGTLNRNRLSIPCLQKLFFYCFAAILCWGCGACPTMFSSLTHTFRYIMLVVNCIIIEFLWIIPHKWIAFMLRLFRVLLITLQQILFLLSLSWHDFLWKIIDGFPVVSTTILNSELSL